MGGSSIGSTRPLRVVLFAERYQLEREYVATHESLARRFELSTVFVDDSWPTEVGDVPGIADADAALFWVPFRTVVDAPSLDWGRFAGVRAAYDTDVYANRSQVISDRWLGRFPQAFRRHGFEIVICTGSAAADDLRSAGIGAAWVPKGVDVSRFRDLGVARDGLCHYGTAYRARQAALHRLRRARIPIQRVAAPFEQLNAELNRFVACLVCNMEARAWPGPLRHLGRLHPLLGAAFGVGPEPMYKNFECAAAGCAPICDAVPDLDELGFVDGETAVTWADFAELIDKLRHWLDRPDELRTIGERAACLVRERHTLDHRVAAIDEVLRAQR